MKVLHLLAVGGVGGIEVLVKEYSKYSFHDNTFVFFRSGGVIADEMVCCGQKVYVMETAKKQVLKHFLKLLCQLDFKQFDAVITHHEDPFIRLFSLILKKL